MTTHQLESRMVTLSAEVDELSARDNLTSAQEDRLREIYAEQVRLRDQILGDDASRTERARALTAGVTSSGRYRVDGSGIADDSGESRTPIRDAAMRQLDRQVSRGTLAARGAETVQRLMTTGPAGWQSWTTRWARDAGSDAYRSAFAKLLTGDQGHLTWTPEEADAYRTVAALQTEQRAMSLTDANGGYMVPLSLDPAIMLTGNGSTNPLRQIARVVQTTSETWQGVTSAGVTAEWKAEAAEVTDNSPTLEGPSIPVRKASAFVPVSFEVEGDALNLMQELGVLLSAAADELTATAYTTGNGTTQPKGLITALASTASVVPGTGSEALAAADAYTLQNALPPRFQANASWQANLSILNIFRQFETTAGALKFPDLHTAPPTMLGRAVHENSNMDGAINPAATEANHVLVYGDPQQFIIADRVGSTVELVPHLFGQNGLPTGQRGVLLWFRTGSDVATVNGFRVLNVATTA